MLLALSNDDIALRQQITYNNDGSVDGFVGDIFDNVSDGSSVTRQACVFMAVAINGSWKIPVGYFPFDSMSSEVRKNLIERCLEFIHGTGAEVVSLTFDGAKSYMTAVEHMGACQQPGPQWKPYLPHPVEGEPPVHVILDAAHMIKLWRNT